MFLAPLLSITGLLSAVASAAPFTYPLSNGFPKLSSARLNEIQFVSGGPLPNGPLPAHASGDAILDLQLLAFNELHEVAFFTQLIENITNLVPGFEVPVTPLGAQPLLNILEASQAQEEMHALEANNALAKYRVAEIQPCKYIFPVSNLREAMKYAQQFTSLILAALQDVEDNLGQNGEAELIRIVAAILGQEGEQNGFYRYFLGHIPAAAGSVTGTAASFLFSALQHLAVVPGSCPNINSIKLPIYGRLTLLTPFVPADNCRLTFLHSSGQSPSHMTYLTGGALPIVVPVLNSHIVGNQTRIHVDFPFLGGFSKGLVIAMATRTGGPFASPGDVASETIFGPALFDVN
ncbi:MAG: hypothetical protein M1828_002863 [Chrysothrix sp. TS-e1954]|nr:MAG: hypothetical protein M1828_002863 [Chrysothrix sp. TS-e1954]